MCIELGNLDLYCSFSKKEKNRPLFMTSAGETRRVFHPLTFHNCWIERLNSAHCLQGA